VKLRVALVALLATFATVLSLTAPMNTASAARAGYLPPAGGTFNSPIGDAKAQYRIEKVLLGAINHAKPGSTIKIALFSFDRRKVARALVAAEQRGVNVQVLLNGHQFTRAMRIMKNAFGGKRTRKSFMYVCDRGCRSRYGFLHTKMYLFSKTGQATDTVMTGSVNVTNNAAIHQWNDLFVKNNAPKTYAAFNTVFAQMKKDRAARPQYQVFNITKRYQLLAMPFPGVTRKTDPIIKILNKISCKGTRGGTGTNGRTKIRVSQHRWSGDRGAWIARKVLSLYAQGCDVKLMHGSADDKVRAVLRKSTTRGRVPVRANGFDETGDGYLDRYSHHKYMTVSGRYGADRSTRLLMTGSSNWAGIGTKGDEIIFLARGAGYVRQWNGNFNHIWNKGSRSVHYRRGMVGFGEPKIGGKHWEND
jgi:phosphatidylserine/phosphatidylglycerophosphate/cardiolipin synthase-like enzyme